jgi:hypothetical protein
MPSLEEPAPAEVRTQGKPQEEKYANLISDDDDDHDYDDEEYDHDDDCDDCDDHNDSLTDAEQRWEVARIDGYRKVGKKRGRTEYNVLWESGERTWEPKQSFRQQDPDQDTGSSYLPVFDEFLERMNKGEVDEYKEGVSGEVGEEAIPSPAHHDDFSSTNNHDQNESDLEAIAARIQFLETVDSSKKARVLKFIVKGGVKVPENRNQAKKGENWKQFLSAEEEELESFSELDVWDLVPLPANRKAVGTRWVYDVKVKSDGSIERYKARLVAQGFSQKQGVDYNETFAPTMHMKTARVLLALAAENQLEVKQYDISTAFLHASLREEVYVKQPPGHVVKGKENFVYKLHKAMYGLKNAPKAFSDHFMGILKRKGFQQSSRDECLWTYRRGKHFLHYLFHVDDVLVVSNNKALRESFLAILQKELKIRDEGPVSKFLGMRVTRLEDGSYAMDQQHYIEKMAELFGISEETKNVEQPGVFGQHLTLDMLPKTEKEREEAAKLPMQQLMGGLIYVNKTRPDVAYAISDVARFMGKWGVEHFKRALLILKYLWCTRTKRLKFPTSKGEPVMFCYVDANYGDSREKQTDDLKWKSQGGYLVFVGCALVSWRSRRHKSRSLSSMESEYMEASEASKEVLWFRELMKEIGYDMKAQTIMYEDNMSCIAFSKNNTNHDRSKHIDIRAYALRDKVKEGVVKLVHVDTKNQLADMMTKHIQKATFKKHVERIFSGQSCLPPKSAAWKVSREAKGMCVCASCFAGGV